ncbi:MAG TPA: hypothetical protein VIK84_00920 [Haloplasmataceae bacterium]
MGWLFSQTWFRYSLIILIVLFVLTLIAFVFAAFEAEHYLNSPFRGGKKIPFKRALKNYLVGLYIVVGIIGLSLYGIIELFKKLDRLPIILICTIGPLIALFTAFITSKNEKYLFMKIKEFVEGFLVIITVISFILGGIGYYLMIFS